MIIDIYSRYVPGWLLATRETAELAEHLLAETIRKHNVVADQLTIHADRGTSMASKTVALLLADLGVTKSHSRPHCSNDNPYSEAQFKTLKYRPEFPDRFGSIEDGRAFCRRFFRWYNHDHRHSGIGFHTPADVHFGRADQHPARASPRPARLPTPLIQNASFASHPSHPAARPSLDQQAHGGHPPHCNSPANWSHQG